MSCWFGRRAGRRTDRWTFFNSHLLSLILFAPAAAALVIMLLPGSNVRLVRWAAFGLSLIPLALSIVLWLALRSGGRRLPVHRTGRTWYAAINATFHLGVDGISVPMVLLTTLLTPLAILISFNIEKNVRGYMALFLLLETGMLGVFMALDLFLFFVFWEIGLVPMYFLINQWGSEKGEREYGRGKVMSARTYASYKFLIYTMAGSLGLLLAIQMIGSAAGHLRPGHDHADLPDCCARPADALRAADHAAHRRRSRRSPSGPSSSPSPSRSRSGRSTPGCRTRTPRRRRPAR